ncbi:transcriptional repressor LexA [Ligilactobacillus sp. WILCCON 0076]|uniref:LexA repressor n=1 Tax=Ligilactobacillus ubinensis TaxID=2876789 RepID=A0A9X2FKX5_9LACO|nr:transcriptional repressor LexA [Ligilactobacillus ubinensis]MCP0886418.1 transcriptional repressor LexA [Ligilactobacillus ubinensis]
MSKISEKRQHAILRYIYDFINEKSYPPTVREICQSVGLSSTSTVHGYLDTLTKNKLITRDLTKPRAMEITVAGLEYLGVSAHEGFIPILGVVTAGKPILAEQEISEYFPLPPTFKSATDLFMLKIRGESMINAGILNGDQVIVRRQTSADNGDIVIAMTDTNEATCKRFFKEKQHIRLQPENDTMAPIILNDVVILGKVVGLYRPLI